MKPVEAMNAEELLLAFQSATRSEWTKGIIETANELLARLRAYEAVKVWIDGHKNGSPAYMLGMTDIADVIAAARDAGKGAG
jgi:hypothetical protein